MLNSEHSHDARPDLVAASPLGRVTRCSTCGALHLRFGNAVLNLDASDLSPLLVAVENSRRKERARSSRADRRTIELYIGESGVGFAFNRAEIAELEQLLGEAERRIDSGVFDSAKVIAMPSSIHRRLQRFPNAPA
jgi:hypothetical protein